MFEESLIRNNLAHAALSEDGSGGSYELDGQALGKEKALSEIRNILISRFYSLYLNFDPPYAAS